MSSICMAFSVFKGVSVLIYFGSSKRAIWIIFNRPCLWRWDTISGVWGEFKPLGVVYRLLRGCAKILTKRAALVLVTKR